MNKTPVQRLIDKIFDSEISMTYRSWEILNSLSAAIKKQEEQAIIKAFEEGQKQVVPMTSESYYKETYAN